MRKPALLFIFLSVFLYVRSAGANPVPDEWARQFNELPRRYVENKVEADRKQLIHDFGVFGLQLLRPTTIDYLSQNFDHLKSLLGQSQRPPYAPNAELQAWYRARARGADRDSMISSLRTWLVSPPAMAPQHGGMQLRGPPEAVRQEIESVQAKAAAMLADWGDRGSLPLMERLLKHLRHSGTHWAGDSYVPAGALEQTIQRLRSQPK